LLWGGGREPKKAGPLRAFSRFFDSEPSLTALGRWGRGTIGGGGCFKIIMVILGNNFEHVSMVLMNFDEF
jgi:hypothetical protein